MVADSLPPLSDFNLVDEENKEFRKRSEMKGKNKFKEKHCKEDLNKKSKLAYSGFDKTEKFTDCMRYDHDNRLDDLHQKSLGLDGADDPSSNKTKLILDILRDPHYERRSRQMAAFSEDVINIKPRYTDINDKEDDTAKVGHLRQTNTDRMNQVIQEDLKNGTKTETIHTNTDTIGRKLEQNVETMEAKSKTSERKTETSVKQYLRVAMEHEEKTDDCEKEQDSSMKDEYALVAMETPTFKSLNISTVYEKEKNAEELEIGDELMKRFPRNKDLINKYIQLQKRGICDKPPREMTSLMETTLCHVKENINVYLQMNDKVKANSFSTSAPVLFSDGRKSVIERENMAKREKYCITKDLHDGMELVIPQSVSKTCEQIQHISKYGSLKVKDNNNGPCLADSQSKECQFTPRFEKDEYYQFTTGVETDEYCQFTTPFTTGVETDENCQVARSEKSDQCLEECSLPELKLENHIEQIIQSIEGANSRIEIELRNCVVNMAMIEMKLKDMQKDLRHIYHPRSSSVVYIDAQDFHNLDETNIHIPKFFGRRNSPLDHCVYKCRHNSSKGDNSSGYHPDSGGGKKNSGRDESAGSNKEFSRKHEDEKDRDEQEDPFDPPDNDRTDGQSKNDPGAETPAVSPNYKYRRKHGELQDVNLQLTDVIGKLKDINENIPPDLLEQLNYCLVHCLGSSRDEDTQQCYICVCLNSLICHFGGCSSEYLQCGQCIPIFNLIIQHVCLCLETNQSSKRLKPDSMTCPIILCCKIANVASHDIPILKKRSSQLWMKLKKYMARYQLALSGTVDYAEMEEFFSMSSLGSLSSLRSIGGDVPGSVPARIQRPSTSYLPSLGIIPEKGGGDAQQINQALSGAGRYPPKSRSEPMYRRLPDGTVISLKQDQTQASPRQRQSVSEYPLKSLGAPTVGPRKTHSEIIYRKQTVDAVSHGKQDVTTKEKISETRKTSLVRKVSFEKGDRKLSFKREEIVQLDVEEFEDDEEFEKTYGNRISSLPAEGFRVTNRQGSSDQLMSLVESPKGIPGIGEVVYGTRQLFLNVIRYWTELKHEYERTGFLPIHLREEGVILEEVKVTKLLRIYGTRYQKNFQWVRMTHLGSGMSGKCHLCMDYNTEFKFCIKKLHISKYEERELDIWSELKHTNVVRLLGAMRYQDKIYILQDFVDGGCLTETINRQKQTKRRLSHWTALCYLKQILEALQYFQTKRIIHEDLKGDNILLIQKSNKLAITDFGVARRINKESNFKGGNPLGTPTQLSPEKAQSKGHGFKSDVWSAVCVLVHMLSGYPPWVKRYPHAAMLNYIIVQHSPPLQDVPDNISLDVQDLIRQGFTIDPNERPSAEQLLKHKAFKLLDEYDPETFSSTLLTSTREIPSTILQDETKPGSESDSKVLEQIQQDLRKNPKEEASKDITVLHTVKESIQTPKDSHEKSSQEIESLPTGKELLQTSGVVDRDVSKLSTSKLVLDDLIGREIQNPAVRQKDGLTDVRFAGTKSSITKEDLEKLGVSMPPDYKTLLERDPTDYYSKYLHDDMTSYFDTNAQYRCYIAIYQPDDTPPDTSESSEQINIDELIENPVPSSGIPLLDLLLSDQDSPEHESNTRFNPDIHKQLSALALEDMMSQSASSTSIAGGFQRSGSHREESDKIDEEYLKLTEELDPVEPLDLLDHKSLMEVLRKPVTEASHARHYYSGSSTSNSSYTRDKESKSLFLNRVPSDSTPTVTLSEHIDDKHSRSERMKASEENIPTIVPAETTILPKPTEPLTLPSTPASVTSTIPGRMPFSILPGHPTLPTLNEPVTMPVTSDQPMTMPVSSSEPMTMPVISGNMGPATLPNLQLISDTFNFSFTNDNERFNSDDLYGSGPQEGLTDLPVGSSAIHMTRTSEENEDDVIDENIPTPKNTEIIAASKAVQPVSLPASQNDSKMHTSKSDIGINTPAKKTTPRPHLDLRKSPVTRRRPIQSDPIVNWSASSSPIQVPQYYTPQLTGHNIEFTVTRARDTSGLGSSLPYMNSPSGHRLSSGSSGVFTSPPLRSSSQLDENDHEIEQHMRDLEEGLSQSSHDTSLYHLSSLVEGGDDVVIDKSPTSWTVGSTSEEESLLHVQQNYINTAETGDDTNNGTFVRVEKPDGQKCLSIHLTYEHRRRCWKDIIEEDLCQQIHLKGFKKFSLNDVNGQPLNLNSQPQGQEIKVIIVEDPTEQHWWCEKSMVFE